MRERLEQEMLKARRHRFELALLFIDLDHFKQVNDTFGHQKGDELLAQVGKRLEECVRESDTVARLGGDEFTLIAVELREQQDARRVADKVLTQLAREFHLGSESVYLSASIGIAFYPDHGEDMNALIRSADRAMYEAKSSGKNQLSIYGEQQKPPCPKKIIPAAVPKS
jgi:diguanylate cyclase (GGDEF)-like protein